MVSKVAGGERVSASLATTLAGASRTALTPLLPAPPSPAWTPTERLAGDREALGSALEALAAELGTDRSDICGQWLIEIWAWTASAPAAAAVVAESRLPDLGAANLLVRLGARPVGTEMALENQRFYVLADDHLRGAPGVVAVPDDGALASRLAEMLVGRLGGLIEAVNSLSGRPRSALWRGASDRLAGGFLWAGERLDHPERGLALARRALRQPGPLAGPVRIDEIRVGRRLERVQVRNGCCIWHRIPGEAPCLSCPLVDRDRRRALAREESAVT